MTYKVDDLKKVAIHIGRAEENEATRVQIDAGSVFAEYPAAVPAMKVISPAGVTYSREVTRDGDMVVWDVVDSDLAAEGYGEMQLTFTENSVKVKSAIAQIRVCRSISGGTTPPDPVQDWLDEAEAALDAFPTGGTTGQVLAKKSDADFDTEWVDQGAGGVSDYDDLENRPQIGGVTLTGDKSLHDLGIAAESAIPDPTSIIDDTAGDGDTNKVWSADKTDAELADVKSAITPLTPDATAEDVGKALIVKTVESGKATEYEYGEAGGGLSNEAIQALLACFAHVAWIDDAGPTYYDALVDALDTGTKTLVSISAVYTQGIVYPEDSLDTLKSSLVITGTYDDTSTEIITEYTLSGTLAVGSSTVTVTVDNITTTFTVDVYGFKPMRCVTMRGSVGSNAFTDQNSSRCLNLCDVGSHKLKDSHGTLMSYYPVPIRSGVSVLKVSVGSDLDTTIQIVQWDSTLNDWKRIYGTDWGFKPSQYSLSSYNDGTYACAIVAAKDSGTPGLPDNTYNFTNHVFSAYDIHFE